MIMNNLNAMILRPDMNGYVGAGIRVIQVQQKSVTTEIT